MRIAPLTPAWGRPHEAHGWPMGLMGATHPLSSPGCRSRSRALGAAQSTWLRVMGGGGRAKQTRARIPEAGVWEVCPAAAAQQLCSSWDGYIQITHGILHAGGHSCKPSPNINRNQCNVHASCWVAATTANAVVPPPQRPARCSWPSAIPSSCLSKPPHSLRRGQSLCLPAQRCDGGRSCLPEARGPTRHLKLVQACLMACQGRAKACQGCCTSLLSL